MQPTARARAPDDLEGQVPASPSQSKEVWWQMWAQSVSSEAFGHSFRTGCLDEPWASSLLYAQEKPMGFIGLKYHPRPKDSLFKSPTWTSALNCSHIQ